MNGVVCISDRSVFKHQFPAAMEGFINGIGDMLQCAGQRNHFESGARRADPFGRPVPEWFERIVLIQLSQIHGIKAGVALQGEQLSRTIVHHNDGTALILGEQRICLLGQPAVHRQADVIPSAYFALKPLRQALQIGFVEGVQVIGHEGFGAIGDVVGAVTNHVHHRAANSLVRAVDAFARIICRCEQHIGAVHNIACCDICLGTAKVFVGTRGEPSAALR